MKVSKYSLREKVKVHASRLRKGVWRCRVQPHRFLAPFPNSSRRFSRSIRAIGRDRPLVSKQATRLIELRGGYRDGGREGIDSGDPRSRLLKPEDGKREFALTQKNLCHSFNGAALRHPALLRDCNVRFDSLRGRINFILRLSSCTSALRRFFLEERSRRGAWLSGKLFNVLMERRVAILFIFSLHSSDRFAERDSFHSDIKNISTCLHSSLAA